MILCIGATPAAQRVMLFETLKTNEVNRARLTLDGFAGKSVNVAKVLRHLGEQPVALGFAGGNRGLELKAHLQARGIEAEFLPVKPQTRQCITIIDESAGTQTELVEESQAVDAIEYDKLIDAAVRRIARCKAVVMSGTITPNGPVDFYFRCTQIAREHGVMPVVDARGALLLEALRARPALVKPNRSELAATVGYQLDDRETIIRALRQCCEQGAERIVVTAGKDSSFCCDGKQVWEIVPPAIQAVNPIGSGDAFTAGLVWRLLAGDDLGESARWASAVAAANALTPMPGEIVREDVDRQAQQVILHKL